MTWEKQAAAMRKNVIWKEVSVKILDYWQFGLEAAQAVIELRNDRVIKQS